MRSNSRTSSRISTRSDGRSAGNRATDSIDTSGAVADAFETVKRHPVAAIGAVAAGVGTYVLIDRMISKRKNGRSRSRSRR